MNKSKKKKKIEETAEFFLKINQSGKHKPFNKKIDKNILHLETV